MALSVGGTPITPEQLATLQADLGIVVAEEITARYTSLLGTDDSIFLRSGVPGLVSVDVMTAAFGDTPPQTLTQSSRFNNSQTFYAPTVTLVSALEPLQSTATSVGVYTPASVTLTLTAGRTVLIYATSFNALGTITSSQGDTIVSANINIASAGTRNILAYVTSAVGGSTTFEITVPSNDGVVAIAVEEWPAMVFNSAAGIGSTEGSGAISPATPNATNVATAVSISHWSFWGQDDATSQVVPTGWTEGRRHTVSGAGNNARVQFVSARRAETTTGIKTAAWPALASTYAGAQIAVFSAA